MGLVGLRALASMTVVVEVEMSAQSVFIILSGKNWVSQ